MSASSARIFGTENVLGTHSQVKAVAADLVFALRRIYKDRNLEFDLGELCSCTFRGEAQDLEEMLGNLMDNACKWASGKVAVGCEKKAGRVLLRVEDDGPGILEPDIEKVLKRGHRMDENVQGHGLGLNIVQEISELYGGTLNLRRSQLGGLCAELDLPSVERD